MTDDGPRCRQLERNRSRRYRKRISEHGRGLYRVLRLAIPDDVSALLAQRFPAVLAAVDEDEDLASILVLLLEAVAEGEDLDEALACSDDTTP